MAITARYWRVYATANGGSPYLSIAEVFLVSGGVDYTTSGKTYLGTTPSGGTLSLAFDGAIGGNGQYPYWAVAALPISIGVDMGSAVTVDRVDLGASTFAAATENPKDFLIQYSSDGTAWSTASVLINQISWTAGERRQFTLEPADANYSSVTLLLPFEGSNGGTTIVDKSSSPKTITLTGVTTSTGQNRFGGSSALFNAPGTFANYLQVGSPSSFDFGASDFTVEAWVYPTETPDGNGNAIFCTTNSAGETSPALSIYHTSGGTVVAVWTTTAPATASVSSSATLSLNTWAHVAVTRSGSTAYIFINGVLSGSSAISGTLKSNTAILIGRMPWVPAGSWTGYMDEFRITNNLARYTSSFTLPSLPFYYPIVSPFSGTATQGSISLIGQTPTISSGFSGTSSQGSISFTGQTPSLSITSASDPYAANVVLLLPLDGTHGSTVFTDYSSYSHSPTRSGGAIISTAQSYFGGASLGTGGSGDSLTVTGSTELDIASSDFTIEMWVYRTSAYQSATILKGNSLGDFDYCLFIDTSGVVYVAISTSSVDSQWFTCNTAGISLNTWYHVAATKSGNTIRIFIDGTLQTLTGTSTFSGSTYTSSSPLYINYSGWAGYIDDLRITKGIARYTTTFTKPTTANPTSPVTGYYYPIQALIALTGLVPSFDNSVPVIKTAEITDLINTITLSKTVDILIDAISVLSSEYNTHSLIHIIEEAITNSGFTNSSLLCYNDIVNSLSALDANALVWKDTVSEGVLIAASIEDIINKIVIVLENINAEGVTIDTAVLFSTLSELLVLVDSLEKSLKEEVIDNVFLSVSLNNLYKAVTLLIDTIIASESLSSSFSIFYLIKESLDTATLSFTNALLNEIVEVPLIFTIPEADTSSKYLAYLLSPETSSVSTYSNYNFNGCTRFGYKYLFYNRTGLYEYGGYLDDGDKVRSEIETVAFNFQTSNLKQVPAVYLGVDSTDSVIIKVRVDGKAEVHYKLNKFTNNLMTQKIDIGKGLIGRYFQFEVITEASEFNMESIEFYPLEIRRKL